ncbi:hypothetical protein BMETH_555_3 [methanotrophic bacterial endosymbiont of Bathymodiolus sp.]|nr:hypothetical protein BMETH_555_3 [methanotrophic bacterial endosymbiont of Bathymodiolus sp.]
MITDSRPLDFTCSLIKYCHCLLTSDRINKTGSMNFSTLSFIGMASMINETFISGFYGVFIKLRELDEPDKISIFSL